MNRWLPFSSAVAIVLLSASLASARPGGRSDRENLHRHGHGKRRSTPSRPNENSPQAVLPTTSPIQRQKCGGTRLPSGCSCSQSKDSYSISCFRAGLNTIPELDVGSRLVKTLNFEQNNLTSVQMGAFFGLKVERLLLANNSISELNFLAFWGLEFHLETLDLSNNHFTRVPFDSLRLLRNLLSLSLTANRITQLRDYDFGYLARLEVLALDKNPIAQIAPHTFAGTQLSLLILDSVKLENGLTSFPAADLKQLKGLSLAHNKIEGIPTGWFRFMKSLKYLCLNENKLQMFAANTFEGVESSLQTVELNGNRFRAVPSEAIRKLPNLETLEMRRNDVRRIPIRAFNESHLLQSLDLSQNVISKVSWRAFMGLENIQKIDLRNNALITLDDRTLYWDNPRGIEVYLGNNPWLCNCLLKWVKQEYRRKTTKAKIIADPLDMLCTRPNFYRDVAVVRMHLKDFSCDHNYYFYYYEDEETTDKDVGGDSEAGEEDDVEDYDYYEDFAKGQAGKDGAVGQSAKRGKVALNKLRHSGHGQVGVDEEYVYEDEEPIDTVGQDDSDPLEMEIDLDEQRSGHKGLTVI